MTGLNLARLPLGLFAVVLTLAVASSAAAASFTLIDGEGFNSGDYAPGILEGQFASTFEGAGAVQWVQSPLAGTGTAEITASFPTTPDNRPGTSLPLGDQAVEVNRSPNSDDRWAVPITGAPAIDMPLVCIEWDMLVEESTSTPMGSFGPFFGIEAYDDDATTILRVGALGVDAATGDVLYTDAASGLVETGVTVEFGEWNSYRMILDYSTGIYEVFLNDQLLTSTAFESRGADQFTDADITAIAAGGDAGSLGATGTAYFDNYRVFETDEFGKIPEPASALLIGIAAVMGLTRRVRV